MAGLEAAAGLFAPGGIASLVGSVRLVDLGWMWPGDGAGSFGAAVAVVTRFIVGVYDLDLVPMGERVLALPIRIGRSALNDVCVSHRLVSEFHARIEEVEGRLCVRDLGSRNGVLVEAVGTEGALRVAAQAPIELEPYGYEFLLSPLLRVRVRPAAGLEWGAGRQSHALGSVLGNGWVARARGWVASGDAVTEGSAGAAGGGAAAVGTIGGAPVAQAHTLGGLAGVAPAGMAPPSVAPPPLVSSPLSSSSGERAPAAWGSAFAQTAPQGSPLGGHAPASVSPVVQPYSSVLVEPPVGSLELPALPGAAPGGHGLVNPGANGLGGHGTLPALAAVAAGRADAAGGELRTRLSPSAGGRQSTLLEPGPAAPSSPAAALPHGGDVLPRLAHTAWEMPPGTLPAAAVHGVAADYGVAAGAAQLQAAELPGRSLEALALRGLRELAASLVPGQSVESASDVVQLITKLHDAMEMFCRCFIPVREACSRFIPADELERAALERCRNGSSSYVAIERALEPRAVAAALLDWRNDDQDAPRAVEQILADSMLHHLGLSQAALDGTRALLAELSPLQIESQQPSASPTMLSRLGLASSREKELWEAFERRHAELESAGRTFRALFGEQFTRAYLAQAPMPGSGSF